MREKKRLRLGFGRDSTDLICGRVIRRDLVDGFLGPDPFGGHHLMLEKDIMQQDVTAHGSLDQGLTRAGVTADHQVIVMFAKRIPEGRNHRSVVDFEGLDQKIAQFHLGTVTDFIDLDIQSLDGRSFLMHHTAFEFRSPDLEQGPDELLGSGRADDLKSTVSTLMPGGNHQLKEIDDVIGVKMRQQKKINVRSRGSSGDQPLRDT